MTIKDEIIKIKSDTEKIREITKSISDLDYCTNCEKIITNSNDIQCIDEELVCQSCYDDAVTRAEYLAEAQEEGM